MFIKRQFVPEKLQPVYVDFYWSTPKLWALDLPQTKINISDLDWILDYPVWYMDLHSTPNELLKDPTLDREHWQRVLKADLHFPIHVLQWKERLLILDGIHRLMKAKSHRYKEIEAKMLSSENIYQILPDDESYVERLIKTQASSKN